MRRREFITLLGGAAAAWPLAAGAQQAARRIGVLMAWAESDPGDQVRVQAFRARLRQLGWIDGGNVRVDYRWTAGVLDRFRTAAEELVALKPDVILADTTPSVVALLRETRTIPIVFVAVTDPVAQGLVTSLARPGGNLTGFTNHEFSMGGKWLGLLKDVAPNITRVGVIYNPTTAPYAESFVRVIEAAAPSLGVVPIRLPLADPAAIDRAIGEFASEPNGGVLQLPDGFLGVHRDRLIALTAQHHLPAISNDSAWTKRGGLISYAVFVADMYRGAAGYVDRILKGEKVSNLPVQAPTKFELIVNLKTAKALGLKISESFLLLADEVIE
jgi:putative ABC transport system substrate-binding protein